MQIIMSPAKTQIFIGSDCREYSMPALMGKTQAIIDLLKTMGEPELARLTRPEDRPARSAHQYIHKFAKKLTLQNAGQAIFTFQGDAYTTLGARRLSPEDLRFAQERLFIFSGLYGILRPLDLIQPYRLNMSAPLPVEGEPNLYRFWREPVTDAINRALADSGERTLVNLASTEYARVIDRKRLQGQLVNVIFQEKHQGGFRTVPNHTVKARGLLARFVITGRVTHVEGLRDFQLDGYSLREKESAAGELIFRREGA